MTIYQHASFDVQAAGLNATSSKNTAVAKMVAAWENKNAKRAVQGSGLALMAMSLTACGGSSTTTPAATTATTTTTTTAVTSNAAVVLTAGPDTLVGDANNDTFNAFTDGFLEAADTITGGGGTGDKLVIRDYDTSAGTFTMSGVEIIDINFATTGATLDLEDVTGVTSLIVDTGVAVNTVANVAATTSLTLANISAGVTDIDITFADGAFDPAANSYSLTLNDVDDAFTLSLDSVGADIEAIDTLNINTGANVNGGVITFDAEGQSSTSVIITGSASASLANLDGTTIDASAATGAITLTNLAAGAAVAMTVTGGSAADIFDFGTGLTSADTVVGGLGNDTLILSSSTGAIIGTGATANVLNVSGVEILRLDTALTGAITIDADRMTGLTIIDIDGIGQANETVTITDLANASTVRVSAALADTLSIDVATNTASDTFTLSIDGAGVTLADVDTSNAIINTMNIVSGGTGANVITDASGVTVGQIIVTGAQTLDMNNNALAVNVTDFDASGATAAVTVLMGAVATTITGGTGGDTLSGGSAADVISGGGGADIIDGNGGVDILTGGAGADVFIIAEGADTINDFVVGLANDDIHIDLSGAIALSGAAGSQQFVHLDDNAAMASTSTILGVTIAAAQDLGTVATNSSLLIVSSTTAFTTATLEDALEVGGSHALTMGAAMLDDDSFFVLFDDGTDSFLSSVTNVSAATVANNTSATAGEFDINILVTFDGIADATTILGGQFADIVA